MGKVIYPYLIEEQKMNTHYQDLINQNYDLIFFDKDINKNIYDLYLPHIRNYMFWTFNITNIDNTVTTKKEYSKMTTELKAAVCNNYKCNIFRKKDNIVICFSTGICFIVTNDKKSIKEITNENISIKMEKINLKSESVYNVSEQMENNEAYLYLYVLQLYKMIFLNKIQQDIQITNKFHKTRREFVLFIEKIYGIKATDDKEALKQIEKWNNELDIEKTCLNIDNEFDILYKNNKLNENIGYVKMGIMLAVIAIIIGIIILWGMIQ